MRSHKSEDRRRSRRHLFNRMAKIQMATGTLPRDCLVTDISDGGVRLHIEGFEVPDEFVLLLSGDGVAAEERTYRVVWRLGYEIGAQFVGFMRRSSFVVRGSRKPAGALFVNECGRFGERAAS